MRHLISLLAGLALLGALGCKPPPKEQAIESFRRDVRRYFDEQNRQALDRKDRLRADLDRAQRNPHMDPATGTVYSTFLFDPEGFVVENYKCQACGTSLMLTAPSAEYLCRSCGHSPYKSHTGDNLKASPCPKCVGADGKPKVPGEDLVAKDAIKTREGATVKDMFELTAENPEKPLVAKVRYVRKLWVFDARGTVTLSEAAKKKATASSDIDFIPTEGGTYNPQEPKTRYSTPGFHRLDGTYVGEIEFQWSGGTLTEKSRQAEVAVRPWKDLTTVGK
jgi:hypothetical protein